MNTELTKSQIPKVCLTIAGLDPSGGARRYLWGGRGVRRWGDRVGRMAASFASAEAPGRSLTDGSAGIEFFNFLS